MKIKTFDSFTIIVILLFVGLNKTLKSQVLEQDSLALVALYDSTDGLNWSNSENWLSAPVSTWYGIIVENDRVTSIELLSNNLVGMIPPQINRLDSLKVLSLGRNQLIGEVPIEIFELENLTTLYLDHNLIEGELSSEISNLENLKQLNLGSNQLSGEIPAELFSLTQLTYFEIYSNQLTGEIPAEIGNLTNLQTLSLSNNQFSGEIFIYIVNMTKLRMLFLPNNSFTGIIPSSIENLTQLYHFNVAGNEFTGEIPSGIGDLTNLNFLHLADNQLTGSIPPEIENLSNLETLYLYRNQLSGGIPSEIGSLSNLTKLYLSENDLSGEIPKEIGNLAKLEQLYLQNNKLLGSLPVEITTLLNLERLYLDRNDLQGAIPDEITNLTKLRDLQLFDNEFIDLPNLSSLPLIEELEIQNNKFTFEDIEPNIDTFYCSYSPQDSVGLKIDTMLALGESFTLSVEVGGSANTYQWTKDGKDIPGAIESIYNIDSAHTDDTGIYVCKINNTIATELTLFCREINVFVGNPVVVENSTDDIPRKFELSQNFPNPFNPSTAIQYQIPLIDVESENIPAVKLKIFDILGREVTTLVNQKQKPGNYEVVFHSEELSSGIYFYELKSGEFRNIKKMILLR